MIYETKRTGGYCPVCLGIESSGGCKCQQVIGHCAKHPGQSLFNCPQCAMEETAEKARKVRNENGWTIHEVPHPLLDPQLAVRYADGQPCKHPGCQHHITHPCEGCGRIRAQGVVYENIATASINFKVDALSYGHEDDEIVETAPMTLAHRIHKWFRKFLNF